MATTAHGEVDIEGRKALAQVTLGDDVERSRVVKDVVIESEVTAKINVPLILVRSRDPITGMHVPGDEVHTPLFEAGPASLLDIGGSLGKFIGRELASPVGLHSFLNLTVCTYGNAEREMNNIDGDQ